MITPLAFVDEFESRQKSSTWQTFAEIHQDVDPKIEAIRRAKSLHIRSNDSELSKLDYWARKQAGNDIRCKLTGKTRDL